MSNMECGNRSNASNGRRNTKVQHSCSDREVDEASIPIRRTNILGIGISLTNMRQAVKVSEEHIRSNSKGYICATDVHTIIEAQSDSALRSTLNRSVLTTPDGMPLVWIARLRGWKQVGRVYGPDFMLEVCRHSVQFGYKHFLYGGCEGVAERLRDTLITRFPGLQIVGTYSPPFRALNEGEEASLSKIVEELKPDIFWVGLGSPKQERFMAKYHKIFDAKLMVGVGAAFDFHSGRVKEAPEWLKESGFQWLYRVIQEPRRLLRRYISCIPQFLVGIILQTTKARRYKEIS
jgi:N-acetylglucosaminyldiphosphoundecaprenol N-acetyl-beta-D-mannosaminyltransferase